MIVKLGPFNPSLCSDAYVKDMSHSSCCVRKEDWLPDRTYANDAVLTGVSVYCLSSVAQERANKP